MKKTRSIVAGLSIVAAAALIAGCGGGSSSTISLNSAGNTVGTTPVGPLNNIQTAALTVNVQIPPVAQRASVRRNPAYVSPSTASLSITANGPSTVTGNGTCTSTMCTATVNAPINATSITVVLRDASSQVVAQATKPVTITAGIANTITMIFDGVASNVRPSATVPYVVSGVPSSFTVILAAYDDAGNQIISPGNIIDSAGTVLVSPAGSTQTLSLAVGGADGQYLTLSALTWNAQTYQVTATATYNDGGNRSSATIPITPSSSTGTPNVTFAALNLAEQSKSISIIADPMQTPNGYAVGNPTSLPSAPPLTTQIEVPTYPTPNPLALHLALVSNFDNTGATLQLTNDTCSTFSFNDPGLNAAFPSPGPVMPGGMSDPFTVNIAGPSPMAGNTNISCTFQINDTTNGVSAIANIGLNSTTLFVQGQKRK